MTSEVQGNGAEDCGESEAWKNAEEERASHGDLDVAKPLSKNAQKKLLKMERYKAKKLERKAFEKSKRHEDSERKRKEWETKLSSLSAQEQDIALAEKKEKRQGRKEKANERKARLRGALQSGQNLVIDLEFCDRMKPNELASLVQQVMYSYAANGKAAVPVRFSLTGCEGEILGHLERVSGFENWLVHREKLSYLEVFKERKQDLIYLTADSDCVIDQLEDSKIYIIGGLVDRNRWKGLTLEKARSQGISTAQLPIHEHLKMTSSVEEEQAYIHSKTGFSMFGRFASCLLCAHGQLIREQQNAGFQHEQRESRNVDVAGFPYFQVLTVNQVVEIFLRFLEFKNWEEALQEVIPLRKRYGEEVHNDSDQTHSKIFHNDECGEKDVSPQSSDAV